MEENNTNSEQNSIPEDSIKVGNKHICFENHCWKMCLGMVIAAFLGGFLATYFVADQIAERQLYKFEPKHVQIEHPLFDEFEDIQKHQPDDMKRLFDFIRNKNLNNFQEFEDKWEKDFDDNLDREIERHYKRIGKNPFEILSFNSNEIKIKTKTDNDKYEVIVGLKPFQNDENKINYNLRGKKLTVFGNSEIKEKGKDESIAFSQDFILPDNAQTMGISKKKDGDKLIISVPLEK